MSASSTTTVATIPTTTTTATPVKTITTTATDATSFGSPQRASAASSCNSSTTTTTLPANDIDVIQDMIDISADRLEGLRTQCATSATLTQKEIRSLESKLVRMFSELLLTKARLNERIPANGLPHTTGSELKQWLRVVGLSQDSLNVCLTRLSSLEQLMEQSDEELRQMLCNNPSYRDEEVRRLTKAMQNLRKCKESLLNNFGTGDSSGYDNEILFWDSWDRHHHHHRGSIGNIGVTSSPRSYRMLAKQTKQQQQQQQHHHHHHHHQQQQTQSDAELRSRQSPSNDNNCKSISTTTTPDDLSSTHGSTLTLTPTPSPPNSPFAQSNTNNFGTLSGGAGSLNGTPQRSKPVGTPPPMKKHQTLLASTQPSTPTHGAVMASASHDCSSLPLGKSKSNESQFHDSSMSATSSPPSLAAAVSRSRIHTDPSPDSYSSASSDTNYIENNNNPNNLQLPRSPCTPIVTVGMGHTISHRFTKVFKVMSTCDLCLKQMFFGLKCKECKYRCHKDCEPNVPPSCGLPREFVDVFKQTLKDKAVISTISHTQPVGNTSPNLNTYGKNRSANMRPNIVSGSVASSHNPDSSSPGSSCNSSSPSSPALFNLHHQHNVTAVAADGGGAVVASSALTGTNSGIGTGTGVVTGAGIATGASNGGSCSGAAGTHIITNNPVCSSGGGSSSTSSNLLSTPSSFQKNASQFNFPDVTITSNCNQSGAGAGEVQTQTLYSSQTSASESSTGMDVTSPNAVKIDSETVNSEKIEQQMNASSYTNAVINSITGNSSISTTASIISYSVTNSMVSSTGTFYPRKLSSAGVDKRAPLSELADTHKSNDSDKTVSLSGSTSASTDSDRTPVRLDSTEDGDSGKWPRQNSLSLKEWDIPYSDLEILEQIGKGRFGTVHRALWHGDVAVKLLKEDYLDDEHMLEAFKLEVANFKKTRHENLVLFMGACMNPPYLAIVTSLCKGNTLYTYIHARRDKFTINKTTLVAQQISQGMGYLHARGIIHKDLRTKNIFLENGKVIITDFGLFSSTKLLYCDIGLGVPPGWLCYMAPELMRALMPRKPADEILPFSKASDVYSFGCVWYELLCGEFPFKMQPPESIIWQVGRGMKQTLANLQTSRDVKDILMLCWSFQADDRPDFPKLLTLLERLPKKRLARSPSHPIQLSRSAESVF